MYIPAALSHFCVRLFDPSWRVLKLSAHVTDEKRFTGRAHKDFQLLLIHPLIQREFHFHPFFNLTKILIPGDTKEFRAASHENIARLATRFFSALLAFRPGRDENFACIKFALRCVWNFYTAALYFLQPPGLSENKISPFYSFFWYLSWHRSARHPQSGRVSNRRYWANLQGSRAQRERTP